MAYGRLCVTLVMPTLSRIPEKSYVSLKGSHLELTQERYLCFVIPYMHLIQVEPASMSIWLKIW